jgi:hypothetical protein
MVILKVTSILREHKEDMGLPSVITLPLKSETNLTFIPPGP